MKKIIPAVMLWIISPLSGCDSQNTNNLQEWNKEKIIKILTEEEKEDDKEVKEKTAKFPENTEEKIAKHSSVENSNNIENFIINSKDLEWTPFFGKTRMITPSYGNLLWHSQSTTIMMDMNNKKIENHDCISENESITIPLIYPELKSNFSDDLWDFLNKFLPEYKNETGNDIIIVTQCKNGKNALWYYKNWKLKLATYVSIWTKHRATIKGKYSLKHDQIRRRSRRYHNSAMPYSILIKWWYYLHQWRSNWKPQSHWCVRVPWLYQKWLYENIPDWTVIILDWLYKPTI